MKTGRKQVSLWQESMKVGLPELDLERKNTLDLLELLQMRPLYSVASEAFSTRFLVVQEAIEKFLAYEESLMTAHAMPDDVRRQHLADHEKLRWQLQRIKADAANKKNQTVLDVYRDLRGEIKKHVLTFGAEMSHYIVAPKTKNSVATEQLYETEPG